jgi:NitT/TauT family transport system substrate-binding protein
MKKLISLLTTMVLSTMMFAGCANANNSTTAQTTQASATTTKASSSSASAASVTTQKSDMHIAALKGPTAMGMVKLMEDYPVEIFVSADEIVTKMVKGELDIATVPANLASVLYNKTQGKISVSAINTLGVLYVVEIGDSIKTIQDLKGKTILSTGKGTTPEFALNYILSSNGIDPQKDVTIEYKSESTEIATALSAGLATVALLPEPFVTTAKLKNDKLHVALNMSNEWDKVGNGSSMVTGVVIARNEFIEKNKEPFNQFLDQYKASTDYVNKNIEEASKLVEKRDIVPAAIAKVAIPQCNITFIDADAMQKKLSGYIEVLFKQNPNSVGGALPSEKFYYKR